MLSDWRAKLLLVSIIMELRSILCLILLCLFFTSGQTVSRNVQNISWSCLSDASCLKSLAQEVTVKLRHQKTVDLGLLQVERTRRIAYNSTGRSSTFLNFLNGKAIKIPLGPMVIGVEPSEEYPNYFEVALLKKDQNARGHHDRKHMRWFVPAFLVASQFGWYALGLKFVTVLAIKAFLVAKVALLVTAIMTLKKLVFEQVHPNIPLAPAYDPMDPYMMPLEFPGYGHSDLHPLSLGHLGHHDLHASPALHHAGNVAAESSVNSITDQNNAAASAASGQGKSLKRSDFLPECKELHHIT